MRLTVVLIIFFVEVPTRVEPENKGFTDLSIQPAILFFQGFTGIGSHSKTAFYSAHTY